MKPHLLVKLHRPLSTENLPHWVDFIRDKSLVVERLGNAIDALLQGAGLDFWVTREYKPAAGPQFSAEEVASGLNRIYRLILQRDTELPVRLINSIRLLPEVETVREAEIARSELPEYTRPMSTGGFFDHARNSIFVKEAHFFTKGHAGVKIAILDTGLQTDHPELTEAIEKQADFVNLQGLDTTPFIGDTLGFDDSPLDEIGHGTHVAGIIAGKGLQMPEGIAPRCRIYAVRVLATLQQDGKPVGAGLIDNINVGIKWAVDQGADVINMSLGIRHEHGGLPHREVVEYALRKGVTIVAASGNDGNDEKYYPGALPGVIAVGAVDAGGRVAGFSTYGRHVALVAPGENILSSYIGGSYAVSSGTSQAAPFVSGAVALLKSYGRERGSPLTDAQIKHILKHTSDKPDRNFKTDKSGYGRINLIDALKFTKNFLTE